MFYCMQIVYINIFTILRNIWKVLRRNENDNRNWAKFRTPPNATRVVFVSSSSTWSAPNTKPVGLYPAHPWAPGRGVGEEGERMNRGWKSERYKGPKVSYINPTHNNSSSPTPHSLGCSGGRSSDPTGPHTSACSPNPARNWATAAHFGFLAPTPTSLAFHEPMIKW